MKALLLADIRFQFRYGFYFVYLVFSLLYIGLLSAFPDAWREKAGIVMVYTDPAAMGLFFMGAIILFEKSERVLNSIAISPVKPFEYVLSKLFSIALISTLVGFVIGMASGGIYNIFGFIAGVFLCSCMFSAVGLIIASRVTTLNQFVIATIPAELLINTPALAYIFGFKKSWLLFHPGVSMVELCTGGRNSLIAFVILFLWSVFFAAVTCRSVKKMLQSVGGIKL
jgi:fluoroquinolone transport system permease protein